MRLNIELDLRCKTQDVISPSLVSTNYGNIKYSDIYYLGFIVLLHQLSDAIKSQLVPKPPPSTNDGNIKYSLLAC